MRAVRVGGCLWRRVGGSGGGGGGRSAETLEGEQMWWWRAWSSRGRRGAGAGSMGGGTVRALGTLVRN